MLEYQSAVFSPFTLWRGLLTYPLRQLDYAGL